MDKVDRHVADAVKKGAKVLVGGERREGEGYFFQVRPRSQHGSKEKLTLLRMVSKPTVLTDVQRCEIDEDETFGPVAALYRFKTEEEVIKRANEPRVGLAG